jgi:hypothetical protein
MNGQRGARCGHSIAELHNFFYARSAPTLRSASRVYPCSCLTVVWPVTADLSGFFGPVLFGDGGLRSSFYPRAGWLHDGRGRVALA